MKQVLKSLLISCVIASVASKKTGSQRRRLKVNLIISYLCPACRRLLRFMHGVCIGDTGCRYVVLCIVDGAEWLLCFDLIAYFSVLSILFCPSTPLFNYRGERLVKVHIQRHRRGKPGRAAALTLTRWVSVRHRHVVIPTILSRKCTKLHLFMDGLFRKRRSDGSLMTHVNAEERTVGMMPNTYRGIFSPPFIIPLMATNGKHALNLPTYEASNSVN